MTRPLWLLDVDGVINAVSKLNRLRNEKDHWTRWETFQTAPGFVITYAPELIERMNALSEKVEIVWLTTWWDNIHHLPFAHWHTLRVGNRPEGYRQMSSIYDWWKLPVAQRLYEGGKMVWTDDDINSSSRAGAWLDENPDILAISPDTRFGLTPAHMTQVEEYLNA